MDTAHKLAQFEDRTRQAAKAILPHASLSVVERRRDLLKIRIGFGKKTFIDIFYNPKNDCTDYALYTTIRESSAMTTSEGGTPILLKIPTLTGLVMSLCSIKCSER